MAAKRSSGKKTTGARPPFDQPTFGGQQRRRPDRMPGLYFVRVKPDAVRPHVGGPRKAGARAPALNADLADSVPRNVAEPFDFLRKNVGLKNVRPLFEVAGRTRMDRSKVTGAKRHRLAIAASVASMEDDDLAGLAIAELDPKARAATIAKGRELGRHRLHRARAHALARASTRGIPTSPA